MNSTAEYLKMNPTEIVSVINNVILILLGLPGNVVIIAVYGRKKKLKSTDTLIMSEACLDLIGTLIAPIDIIRTIVDGIKTRALCKFTIYSIRVVAYASLYMTTAIAVDRCILIRRPFNRSTKPRKALFGVAFCILFAGLTQSYNLVYVDLSPFNVCVRCGMPPTLEQVVSFSTTASIAITFLISASCYAMVYRSVRKQNRIGVSSECPRHQVSFPAQQNLSTRNNDTRTCHSSIFTVRWTKSIPFQEATGVSSKESLKVPVDSRNEIEILRKNGNGGNNDVALSTSRDQGEASETAFRPSPVTLSPDSAVCLPLQRSQAQPSRRRSMPKTAPRPLIRVEQRTTTALLVISIVFFILWLPSTILNHIPGDQLTRFRSRSPEKNALIYACFAIRSLNHVSNMLIHTVVNTSFRRECRRLLRKV